jgi:hypothetical protein
MQELEDTGLSKEEILYNKPMGLPLKQDKFFQFLKKNRIAREMLIKPTESFNVDTVIEKALKQNIGPDPSIAVSGKNLRLKEDLPFNYEVKNYKDYYTQKTAKENTFPNNDDYDYKTNYVDKLKLQLNSESKIKKIIKNRKETCQFH